MAAADFIGVDSGTGQRTGIQAFLDNDVVSIMAVPGVTDPDVQLSLAAHCEKLASRFAVLDMPRAAGTVQEILKHRHILDTTYAAFYHPWLRVFDPWINRTSAYRRQAPLPASMPEAITPEAYTRLLPMRWFGPVLGWMCSLTPVNRIC